MIDERLSAFLDGECDAEELQAAIGALARDPDLRTAWQRQLWIREALQGSGRMPELDAGFADRVIALLPATAGTPQIAAVSRRRSRPRWRRAAGGLAAAASVAAAVVLVDNPLRQPPAPAAAPAAVSVAAGGEAVTNGVGDDARDATRQAARETVRTGERGRIERVAVQRQPADHWTVSDPAIENQLNSYLIEHSGLARGYGLSGATPSFLRVATYRQQAQGR